MNADKFHSDLARVTWLLAEWAVGTAICSVPILSSGGLNSASVGAGVTLALLFLIPSEFVRQGARPATARNRQATGFSSAGTNRSRVSWSSTDSQAVGPEVAAFEYRVYLIDRLTSLLNTLILCTATALVTYYFCVTAGAVIAARHAPAGDATPRVAVLEAFKERTSSTTLIANFVLIASFVVITLLQRRRGRIVRDELESLRQRLGQRTEAV